MIEIITNNGVSLNLDPSGSFEIEIEQPILETDRIPVPYSTPIAFLSTEKNCNEFGYISAMMIEPNIQSLPVDIYINAFKIASGILIYDSIEEGIINYIFSAKDSFTRLENKDIADNNIFNQTLKRDSPEVKDIFSGANESIKAPLLINKNFALDSLTEDEVRDFSSGVVFTYYTSMLFNRYHNYKYGLARIGNKIVYPAFTPAIRVYDLLVDEFNNSLSIDESIINDLKKIYLLCLYKPEGAIYTIALNSTFPKLNKLELFSNIAKIFGASFFKDGDSYQLLTNSNIITSSDVIDWRDKVSDVYSTRPEPAKTYVLKFEDDSSDNSYDAKNSTPNPENSGIAINESYSSILLNEQPLPLTEFRTVQHAATGDIFSVGRFFMQGLDKSIYPTESILRVTNNVDNPVDNTSDIYDNSISLTLPRPVPDYWTDLDKANILVAPVITAPALGEERGSKAIIGIISDNQMTDKGYVSVPTQTDTNSWEDKNIGFSLSPTELISKYHSNFVEWIATRRQVVTVSLNLSIEDISAFRIYKKVYFKGREWLVMKLSISVNVASGSIECTGDFISV